MGMMFFDSRDEFVSYINNTRNSIIKELLKRGFLFETNDKNDVNTFTVDGKTYKYIYEYNVKYQCIKNLGSNYMYDLNEAVSGCLFLLKDLGDKTCDDIHMETYVVERTIMHLIRDKRIKQIMSIYLETALEIKMLHKVRREESSKRQKYCGAKMFLINKAFDTTVAELETRCHELIEELMDIAVYGNPADFYVEDLCVIEVELIKIFCGENKEVHGMSKHEVLKYIKNLYTEDVE